MPKKNRKSQHEMIAIGLVGSTDTAHLTVIPGAPHYFESAKAAYRCAVNAGCNIRKEAFMNRLKKGLNWKEIIKPASFAMQEHGRKRAAVSNGKRAHARAEMHDICVELDRRKAEINNG
jgi:hypothetical protein